MFAWGVAMGMPRGVCCSSFEARQALKEWWTRRVAGFARRRWAEIGQGTSASHDVRASGGGEEVAAAVRMEPRRRVPLLTPAIADALTKRESTFFARLGTAVGPRRDWRARKALKETHLCQVLSPARKASKEMHL
jgi:hypothetical protein